MSQRCHLGDLALMYEKKQAANSWKHDNQPNSDQGVYASNRHAETKIGHDALRLEVNLLAAHLSRRDCA
jgi:hypothetical protein